MSEPKKTPWTVRVVRLYVAFVFPLCGVVMLGLALFTLYPGPDNKTLLHWILSTSMILGITAGGVSATRYLRRNGEETRGERS